MTTSLRQALLSPATVALVGLSSNAKSVAFRPLRFMRQHGFAGEVIAIHPGHRELHGLRCFAKLKDVDRQVDHAYLLTNTDKVLTAFQDCVDAGVRVVTVLADGFAEAGGQGIARQQQLKAMAEQAGILLIGPNSTGVVNTKNGFVCSTNAAFRLPKLKAGGLVALSQSGSIPGTLVSRAQARGEAFSALISVGNEAACDVSQLGMLLLDDPQVTGFVLFLETIRRAEGLQQFSQAARQQGKPVVAYVVGRSQEGQQLAVSHTGALTGSARAMQAYLDQAEIVRAEQFDALFDLPLAVRHKPLLASRPKCVTVLATTGGGGALI